MASRPFSERIYAPGNITVPYLRGKSERSLNHATLPIGMRLVSLRMLAIPSHQCITEMIMLASQMQPGCHVWHCHLFSTLGLMIAASDLLNLRTWLEPKSHRWKRVPFLVKEASVQSYWRYRDTSYKRTLLCSVAPSERKNHHRELPCTLCLKPKYEVITHLIAL